MSENYKVVAQNKKARFNYSIEETLEAGLVLLGSEVKSLRNGKAAIQEAYASAEDGGLYLINAHIAEYDLANRYNHAPYRKRKILLKKKEENRLIGLVERKGTTIVPLSLYFNHRGIAKLTLGVAKGKNKADKRDTLKERDWGRDKARVLKHYNQ